MTPSRPNSSSPPPVLHSRASALRRPESRLVLPLSSTSLLTLLVGVAFLTSSRLLWGDSAVVIHGICSVSSVQCLPGSWGDLNSLGVGIPNHIQPFCCATSSDSMLEVHTFYLAHWHCQAEVAIEGPH